MIFNSIPAALRLLVLAGFSALVLLFSTQAFGQTQASNLLLYPDTIFTKGGRALACRIDQAFTYTVYFTPLPGTVYSDTSIGVDSIQTIRVGSPKSFWKVRDQNRFFYTKAPKKDMQKSRRVQQTEFIHFSYLPGGSHMFSSLDVRSYGPVREWYRYFVQSAIQQTFRVEVTGKPAIGGYIWFDYRRSAGRAYGFDGVYRTSNEGLGVTYRRYFHQKSLMLMGHGGVGLSGTDARLKGDSSGVRSRSYSYQSDGVVLDLAASMQVRIFGPLYVGGELGVQIVSASPHVLGGSLTQFGNGGHPVDDPERLSRFREAFYISLVF